MSGGTRGRLREVTAAGCDGAAFSPVAVHWGLLRSAPAFRLAAAFAARFISVRNARWCASVVAAVFALSAAAGTASAQMFPFTGSEQTYVVPSAATLVHVVAIGAPGGRNGAFQAPG